MWSGRQNHGTAQGYQDGAGRSAGSRTGCDHVSPMSKQREAAEGADLEVAWVTSVLSLTLPFASAARRLRGCVRDSFLKRF